MKKLSIIFISLLISSGIIGQNIGIGTSTPFSKLTLQGLESSANGVNAALQITNTAPGGGSWYLRSGATGTATPAAGFSIANNSGYIFSLTNTGSMGLLTLTPQESLHIGYGNIRLDNSYNGVMLNAADRPFVTRAFDQFTSGPYNGLGRWGLFMEPSRLTLGIPNMPGKAFEVARYELDGTHSSLFGINVNGAVELNGNTGAAGQVLTSNGAGAADWQTAPSSSNNDVRFEASFSGSASTFSPTLNYTSSYNFNTGAVTINSTGITINSSGLYHLEGYYDVVYTFTSAPILFVQQFFSYLQRTYTESRFETVIKDPLNPTSNRYINYAKFSREVYITAPASINCGFISGYSLSGGTSFSSNHSGRISGYLISQ